MWWNRCRTTLDWVVSSRSGVVASSTRTRPRRIRLMIVGSCSPGGELVLLLIPAGRFGTGGFSPPVGSGSSEAETKGDVNVIAADVGDADVDVNVEALVNVEAAPACGCAHLFK